MRDAQEFEFYESKIHASGGEGTADFEAHANHTLELAARSGAGGPWSARAQCNLAGGSEHIQHGGSGDGFSALKVKFIS